MAIKAVIFDCFGVLIVSGTNKLYSDYPEKLAEFNDLGSRVDYGMLSRQEFDQGVAEIIGLPVSEVTEKYWVKSYRNEIVIDWVKDLKKQGKYKIALLSNIGSNWIDDFISKNEINEMFDETVLSGEVMMRKPDPKIFEYAADKLALNPSECVFIDDIMKNVESSQLVGMTGVLFGTFDQAKSDVEQILGE